MILRYLRKQNVRLPWGEIDETKPTCIFYVTFLEGSCASGRAVVNGDKVIGVQVLTKGRGFEPHRTFSSFGPIHFANQESFELESKCKGYVLESYVECDVNGEGVLLGSQLPTYKDSKFSYDYYDIGYTRPLKWKQIHSLKAILDHCLYWELWKTLEPVWPNIKAVCKKYRLKIKQFQYVPIWGSQVWYRQGRPGWPSYGLCPRKSVWCDVRYHMPFAFGNKWWKGSATHVYNWRFTHDKMCCCKPKMEFDGEECKDPKDITFAKNDKLYPTTPTVPTTTVVPATPKERDIDIDDGYDWPKGQIKPGKWKDLRAAFKWAWEFEELKKDENMGDMIDDLENEVKKVTSKHKLSPIPGSEVIWRQVRPWKWDEGNRGWPWGLCPPESVYCDTRYHMEIYVPWYIFWRPKMCCHK